MAPSQLKSLKAALRESGVTGPQLSKKQKRRNLKDGKGKERTISRSSALEDIRERFNPFEVKSSAKGPKYDIAMAKKSKSSVPGRPGVTKGIGEELRRERFLAERQQKNRVGGINDRRFGENDPTMTPDDRAHERYIREKQGRRLRKAGMFDLEADSDSDNGGGLTHLGNPLSFAPDVPRDDYEGSEASGSDGDADLQATARANKRRKLSNGITDGMSIDDDDAEEVQDRPKTKQEIMKEVIAKSKLHKYERQRAKEEDEDLREELDAGLKDVFALMSGKAVDKKAKPNGNMNPDRAALIQGKSREDADKEYDQQLRAMTQEARGRPSVRTKTDEEIAAEEAEKLRELEEKRLRRMRGEESSDSEREAKNKHRDLDKEDGSEDEDSFGLGHGISTQRQRPQLDVEDEDEFELDHDLIASGSEVEISSSDDESDSGAESSSDDLEDENGLIDDEAEFVRGIISADDAGRKDLESQLPSITSKESGSLAYTYSCPATHEEFIQMTRDVSGMEMIKVVQRIRALHSPKLDGKNKAKLAKFGSVLVDHIAYLATNGTEIPFQVIEQIMRHVHSLAKSQAIEIANCFRKHMIEISESRPLALNAGDLMLFTAIGEIFSTSDHFHQVVTPAMLCMAWYLGQSKPKTLGDLVKGAFVSTLFLSYQRVSKRYIPEVVNYAMLALEALAPFAPKEPFGLTPRRQLNKDFRIRKAPSQNLQPLDFMDTSFKSSPNSSDGVELKHNLLNNLLDLVSQMSELWHGNSAYIEIMDPLNNALIHLLSKTCAPYFSKEGQKQISSTQIKIARLLAQAQIDRRPLRLHNHRPLPIKQAIPKFEENYNPDKKSYDPDRDRVESAKLKAEHKKERKGAMREIRKDANSRAREDLRRKKEEDAEYDKKFRRLEAEIQNSEGQEANKYGREKRWRQGKK